MRRPTAPPPELPGLLYIAPLGSGGYSDVYLYEQPNPRMRVAVKVLAAHSLLSERARRQFGAEANAMARLADHPYIVQVFRADIAPDGRPYLVMKYYPQPNLAERARGERFSVADVLRIGIQIASAVEAAHRLGILHRDIKPANVLTGQYGTLGLTDFGIAGTRAEAAGGEIDGISIPWAAPEVLFSAERADERSDVYSIAATLWHLLVGRSPFDQRGGDNSPVALMHRITAVPAPPTGRGDVPPSFERVLAGALAKNPAARPASSLALARSLQAVEQEQRLPLTTIVGADEPGRAAATARPAHAPAGEDGTRVKAPVRVDGADQRAPRPEFADPAPGFGVDVHAARPEFDVEDVPTRRKLPTPITAQPNPQPNAQPPVLPPWQPPQQRALGLPVAGPPAGVPPGPGYPHPGPGPGPDAFPAASSPAAEAPPSAASSPSAEEAAARAERTRRVWYGVGGLAAAAAVAALIVGLNSGGTHHVADTTPVQDSQFALPSTAPEQAPGTPRVTATREAGGKVRFGWTYAGKEAGDSYRWQETIDDAVTDTESADKAEVDLNAPTGKTVCLQVQVYRSTGSFASSWSDPICVG